MATKKSKFTPYPAELKQKMLQLVADGASPEELAEKYPPSAQTIRNWMSSTKRHVHSAPRSVPDELARLRMAVQYYRDEIARMKALVEFAIPEMQGIVSEGTSPFDRLVAPTE